MSVKIIAFAQAKGGVGKSTLCANMAATFSERNRTLVIDCDPPQHSISAWYNIRVENYESPGLDVKIADKPSTLFNLLEQEQDNYDLILLDGPPHINPMTKACVAVASLVIVPLAPSPVEVWSFHEMDKLMLAVADVNAKVEARICWTRVRKRVKSAQYLIDDVNKAVKIKPIASVLTQRVAYLDSFAEGLSVYEWEDPVARAELWSVHSAIQRLLKKSPDPKIKARKSILAWSRQ
ncbi:ParA family protein [Pleionea litopenaei]|uniref:ParA family protein n=1 Tax=Pleionea litopenaei TaxID=3070815 RepID=A0AA51X845_9GAMM|nr:ParA family protein [Pleionea sp. HL-JVS1]WMS87745.1 ParA family protein [Pleionea sp. HL-JVS1]